MRKVLFISVAFAALGFAACSPVPQSSDQQQRTQQDQLSKAGNAMVGMPDIKNFFEKRQFKRILEMRDDPHLQTYTYARDMQGKLHFICDSIGYPIPGATQYTNPSRIASEYQYPTNGTGYAISGSGGYKSVDGVLPQADPNGLFSPAAMDATWVLCQNPNNKNEIGPQYVEEHVNVSLWPQPGALPN